MEAAVFNYEGKQWGGAAVYPRPWYLQGLKLRYCLEDLKEVTGACLDVGCGAGNMAKAIKRERSDLRVFGVDVSQAAIETARREPQEVEFRVTAAERLPFEDSSLDAVTMFDVLEHVEDPEMALVEVRRVLKPGGLFHLVLPLERQPKTIYAFMTARGWQAKRRHCGHIQFFDEASFRALAQGTGLPVRSVRWSFHPLFALIDVGYFCYRDFKGPVSHSVEDYLATQEGPLAPFLHLAKNAITSLGWYESRLLQRFKGGCGHFTCVRSG